MPTANQIIAGMLDTAANAVRGLDLKDIGEDSRALANRLWKIAAHLRAWRSPVPSFTCPCCGAVTYNPNDVVEHYCGLCHWWTGNAMLAKEHFENECPNRVR